MKVCFVISGDIWAGAEVVAARLMEGLLQHPEVAIEAILFNDGRLAAEVRALGIRVSILGESELSVGRIARAVRKIIRRMKPDIVHSHGYKENVVALLGTAGTKAIRLAATEHGMPETHRNASQTRQRIMARMHFFLLARYFEGVVAVSSDIRDALLSRHGFRQDRVRVINNGIPLPPFVERAASGGPVVIGSCGRLYPVKEYPLMVEVARDVAASDPDVRFELSGDGPERSRIEAGVRTHFLESRFVLRGFLDDMDGFYRGLDIYLNTSSHEGIPMSVLEAMSWGLPVVAPNVGGIREIVRDGVDGFLVDGREPRLFAESCLDLVRNPALRAKMGNSARERAAERFTAGRMALDYLEMYRSLLR